jgi:hypothetical protein
MGDLILVSNILTRDCEGNNITMQYTVTVESNSPLEK